MYRIIYQDLPSPVVFGHPLNSKRLFIDTSWKVLDRNMLDLLKLEPLVRKCPKTRGVAKQRATCFICGGGAFGWKGEF